MRFLESTKHDNLAMVPHSNVCTARAWDGSARLHEVGRLMKTRPLLQLNVELPQVIETAVVDCSQ